MLNKLRAFSNLVVLPHSVFALPFALASLFTATHGKPPLRIFFLVVFAMVLARSAAMAYNRLVDADVDARNPRTRDREIPSGRVKPWQARLLVWICGFGFVGTCYFINPLAFKLSPIALAILFFYSYTKRFTWTSHLFLGLALGIAPVGAWVAAKGQLEVAPFWLAAAVICFLAGFDILYATQDETFDKQAGLHSWVERWGVLNSVQASRFFHGAMLGFLAGFGAQCGFPSSYYAGVGLVGAALVYQHKKAYSLQPLGPETRITLSPQMMAVNGWISVLYFVIVGATLWLSNGF